jgi:hypothetical protein
VIINPADIEGVQQFLRPCESSASLAELDRMKKQSIAAVLSLQLEAPRDQRSPAAT